LSRSKANIRTPTRRRSTAPRSARPTKSAADVNAIGAAEFAAALDALDIATPFAVAVSGGADSLALLVLTAEWAKARKLPPPQALTVDHGLRAESALEAKRVARWARDLGVPHETLVWTGAKPKGDVQAAARAARFRLIGKWMHDRGVIHLLTGHTLDDQAETFLLRLARGSGLDGLSAMGVRDAFPLSQFADLKIARPLLSFSHARTVATLRRRKQQWIEDPSNTNERFARVRIRRALDDLVEAGLSADRIALAVAHLRRARDAIDAAVVSLIANAAEISNWGYVIAEAKQFKQAPREVALRALARLIVVAGGAEFPPRFDSLEPVLDWLIGSSSPKGRTLGGCRLTRRADGSILMAREEAALAKEPPLRLVPGEVVKWDGRFLVSFNATSGKGFEVRPLGTAGLRKAGTKLTLPPVEPRRIAATLPALWAGERLVSAPLVGFHGEGRPFSAVFLPLRPLHAP
jgi:tRNA(Ile)-lysidine synthase